MVPITPTPVVTSTSEYPEATISHAGFDFSLGEKGEYPTYDGEIISWQPGVGNNPDYQVYSTL